MPDVAPAAPVAASESASAPSRRLRWLHVATLSAFAITQPLLSATIERRIFLHDLRPDWMALVLTAVVLTFVVPLPWIGLDELAQRVFARRRRAGQWLVLAALTGLMVLATWRSMFDTPDVRRLGLSWAIGLLLAVVISAVFTGGYVRFAAIRQLVTVASAGLIVFPLSFLWQLRDPAAVWHQTGVAGNGAPASRPVPVVVIVLDEACGISHWTRDRTINAGRFPGFARLAAKSNWYRNATASFGQTERALPAILSGQMIPHDVHPVPENYPQNLFSLLHDTGQFEMTVFEPMSRLCPDLTDRQRDADLTLRRQIERLLSTLALVYPRLVLPKDFPLDLPPVPDEWFGLSGPRPDDRSRRTGLFRYYWDSHRETQIRHFQDCLKQTSDRPGFHFLHVVLPHYPWNYLPSGAHYMQEMGVYAEPRGTRDEHWGDDELVCRQSWQRYLLQMGFVDRFIGEVLDALEASGRLDQALVIVTGDHGVSFMPGTSRRKPDARNVADILSVPLFVKLPGQQTGRVIDRNVETVDLLPTIADVIGLKLPEPVDGQSMINESLPPKPRKTHYYGTDLTVIEPDFPQAGPALQRMLDVFGDGADWSQVFQIGPRQDLVGLPLAGFTIEPSDGRIQLVTLRRRNIAEKSPYLPALIQGRFVTEIREPQLVVFARGGVIRAVARTFLDPPLVFELMLDESVPPDMQPRDGEFFVLHAEDRRLQRLKVVADPLAVPQ